MTRLKAEMPRLYRRARELRRTSGTRTVITRGIGKLAIYAAAPLQKVRARNRSFSVAGKSLPYFAHSYNATWRSERSIEIPLAFDFLSTRRGRQGLEVGNVLSYYTRHQHEVLDKYEIAPGVLNVDIVDYFPSRTFDWIISISTLEHVGWDERPRSPAKVVDAVAHLRSLLASHGRMLVTAPRGYNGYLDQVITEGALEPDAEFFMHRDGGMGWSEEPREQALARTPQYDLKRCRAYDLWIAEFTGSA